MIKSANNFCVKRHAGKSQIFMAAVKWGFSLRSPLLKSAY